MLLMIAGTAEVDHRRTYDQADGIRNRCCGCCRLCRLLLVMHHGRYATVTVEERSEPPGGYRAAITSGAMPPEMLEQITAGRMTR